MSKTIDHKEQFIKALSTLFFSWGWDTPEEVYWGANELLDWYEQEFDIKLNIRFEINPTTFEPNYTKVIETIQNT